ncbi:MAG: hypothetical protein HY907_02025 [Deltaproteobacteria bacterium]|nr:hypothetical protein [Deltaproteobacteria bacterium]
MSQPKPGRPVLTVCPACKLAYAPEKNPKGCPYCASNPDIARQMREREREERARQGPIGPRVMGWFGDTRVRLGGIVLAVIMGGIAIWIWSRTSEVTGRGSDRIRGDLIRIECGRAGAMPGSPALDECVRQIQEICGGYPVQAVADCARDQLAERFRMMVMPPPDTLTPPR